MEANDALITHVTMDQLQRRMSLDSDWSGQWERGIENSSQYRADEGRVLTKRSSLTLYRRRY